VQHQAVVNDASADRPERCCVGVGVSADDGRRGHGIDLGRGDDAARCDVEVGGYSVSTSCPSLDIVVNGPGDVARPTAGDTPLVFAQPPRLFRIERDGPDALRSVQDRKGGSRPDPGSDQVFRQQWKMLDDRADVRMFDGAK